jgi:four helix bundle protein
MMVHRVEELETYQESIDAAMLVFEWSKAFPFEERFSLTDQIRRASRSVSGNISEAWRKRRYVNSFVSKMNDAEGEAGETLTWTLFAQRCGYWSDAQAAELNQRYDRILARIVSMITRADDWCAGIARQRT